MKHARPVLLALAGALLSGHSLAQMSHDHSMMQAPKTQGASTNASAMAEGEVRKVDRARGTVTLKHGPLVAVNMPAMTMSFTAKDPQLLAKLKEGDKVRFTPELGKDGQLVVTTIEVVKP